jgi:3D (Asp-Asp-Asp) domain-containing protein
VLDRGGAIKGNKLDVFFPTHAEALKWGRQRIAVTVLD